MWKWIWVGMIGIWTSTWMDSVVSSLRNKRCDNHPGWPLKPQRGKCTGCAGPEWEQWRSGVGRARGRWRPSTAASGSGARPGGWLNYFLTELLMYWTVTGPSYSCAELLLDGPVTWLHRYLTEMWLDWAVTCLSCYCTGLLLDLDVSVLNCHLNSYLTELLLDGAVTWLNWYFTELCADRTVTLLNGYSTELFLYWAVTWLNCYVTELLLYWGVTFLVSSYFYSFSVFKPGTSNACSGTISNKSSTQQIKNIKLGISCLPPIDKTLCACAFSAAAFISSLRPSGVRLTNSKRRGSACWAHLSPS